MQTITEHGYGAGGIPSSHDSRDFQYEGIASASAPFDWTTILDLENKYKTILPNGLLPRKNQYSSLSCGGQGTSQYGAVIEAAATGTYEEESALFEYAPVACPGGGSQGRDLMDRE